MDLSESNLIEFKDVITSVKHTNITIISVTIFVYYM